MSAKDVFKEPISGGNSFATKKLFEAIDNNIKSNIPLNSSLKKISKALANSNLRTAYFTYGEFWLLNFQADYFANLVNFKFEKWHVNRAVNLAIKMGVLYGAGAIKKIGDKYVALYISEIIKDEYGYPSKIKWLLADKMLISQSTSPMSNRGIIESDVDENTILFIPNDVELGGLIKWYPFIKQLENLLKMLYTHSYSYVKSVLYNVSDPNAITDEIDLYFNLENPFLINTSDDAILQNKFKEFKINSSTNSNDLINYIKEFLNIYYDLIGRRYNSDKKKERNVSDEVNATQENYDILQRPYKQNIMFFIDEIKQKWNENYILEIEKSEKSELENDESNYTNDVSKVSQKALKR